VFIDFASHPSGKLIEADVCVIGAGAAGISIAHALIGSKLDVCVIETGGLTTEAVNQALAATTTGYGDYGTRGCRLRMYGGTTNHWAGQSMPLDTLDFDERAWVPFSGWPIDRETLEPWYEAANTMVDAGVYAYTKESMSDGSWPFPELDFKLLKDVYWRIPLNATEFGENYRGDLERAENIRIYLNATVTALHASDDASAVETATIREHEGNTATVRAHYFVVAAGAMESTRLLLASNDVVPTGLGNQTDMLGRFFMMHPHVDIGQVMDISPQFVPYFSRHVHGGAKIIAGISPGRDIQEKERILNGGIELTGIPDNTTGYYALRKLYYDFLHAQRQWDNDKDIKFSDEFDDWVWQALLNLDSTLSGVWERSQNREVQDYFTPGIANIFLQSEQAPNPDSRITLSSDVDSLGVPRMNQDCRILPIDKRTLRVSGELLGRELGRLGAGRVKLVDWLYDDNQKWDRAIWGGCHHMGTTRMSETPATGVVDANCKLHTVDNTYVASGSVFTTGGHANPTITIVALALRLADHLESLPG
jgi:choline dehydrogenase-like flavoprotein